MKPTGATKESRNLIRPLPWTMNANRAQTFDISDETGFPIGQFYDRAEAVYMITAVNERARLLQLLRAATSPTKCYCNVMNGKTCWQCQSRAVLNDATPSTSAGGG